MKCKMFLDGLGESITIMGPNAGAIAFAASAKVITDINPVLALICGLLVSGSVHAVNIRTFTPAQWQAQPRD